MPDRYPGARTMQTDPERKLENQILRGRMERVHQKLLALSGRGCLPSMVSRSWPVPHPSPRMAS